MGLFVLGAVLAPGAWAAPAAPEARTVNVVAVGDLIIARPLSQLQRPGALPGAREFADTVALLKASDVTFGNLETTIADIRNFAGVPYSWDGDWLLLSVPAVAADLARMHFGLVARANNHALDWGLEGMRETSRHVAAAGLVQAGVGEDAAQALAPGYYMAAPGKIGLVSMASTFRPTTEALARGPEVPRGRPGINGLHLAESYLLDRATYARAAELGCHFAAAGPCPPQPLPAQAQLFEATVRPAGAGERAFTHTYSMDSNDLARIMDGIASAKAAARYLIVAIHAHEQRTDEDPPDSWDSPGDFLRELAHQAIDRGADLFVVTGIHHVAGLELYHGKAIFYGLGNFFWSDIQLPLPADLYASDANRSLLESAFAHPARATDADLTLLINANSGFATRGDPVLNRTFHGVLTRTAFDDATRRVKEIRLCPVDLGYGRKLTASGIPRRAGRVVAELVLDRMIAMSAGSGLRFRKLMDGPYLIGVATPDTGR
jgi:poly-gamma-glutamate capsule biosynthesis protein CapA/YwtB (metallophosphatase superfamily)